MSVSTALMIVVLLYGVNYYIGTQEACINETEKAVSDLLVQRQLRNGQVARATSR